MKEKFNLPRGIFKGCLFFLFICFFSISGQKVANSAGAYVIPHGQTTQLLPFLEYFLDESYTTDIEEIAVVGPTNAFTPLVLDKLPLEDGIMWLKFTLAPLQADLRPETYLLDMGQGIPGTPILYVPIKNELSGTLEWRENTPAQRNILLMPEQARQPLTCYIRLDGLPGPWFDPVIRSPHNAATNWGSLFQTGTNLSLAVILLLALLRGLNENGQWRIWTGLFIFFALMQAILGLPPFSRTFSFAKLCAVMCPGLALLTYPHIGRHLLKTNFYSRNLDIQLLFLSLPGIVAALLPLAPGFGWLDRWLELWPILFIFFIPTTLAIWIGGIPGSLTYLLATLIPPLFTILAWLGLNYGFPANILASLPEAGVALCALLLVAVPVPAPRTVKNKKDRAFKENNQTSDKAEPDIINLNHPFNDPNLKIYKEVPASRETKGIPQPHSGFDTAIPPFPRALESKESSIRNELDNLIRETNKLSQCSLPPATRIYAENIINSSNLLSRIVTDPDYREKQENNEETIEEEFNLQTLLRGVHDAAIPIAEHAGLSLSWYMPPYLPQLYRGNGPLFANTLSLLVDSSIRGTSRGNIKISVRRVPESEDPGHLLFTVSDSGTGAPPLHRSVVALAKAWELAARHNGFLGMESGSGGLNIAFSAHLPLIEEETRQERNIQVIIAGSESGLRRELAGVIDKIPYNVYEVPNIEAAARTQLVSPVNLLIVTDSEARPACGDILKEFINQGHAAGFSKIYILAVTRDDSEWQLLKASGFTHAMLEPIDPEVFKETVSSLIQTLPDNNDSNERPKDKEKGSREEIIELSDFSAPTEKDLSSKNDILNLSRDVSDIADSGSAPQMLDEQNFDLSQNFEAPDWLLDSKKSDNSFPEIQLIPQTEEKSATGDNQDQLNKKLPGDNQNPTPDPQPVFYSFDAEIGDPSPISPPGNEQAGENRAENPARTTFSENKGQGQSTLTHEAQNGNSVVDLIVSIESSENDGQTEAEKSPSPESGKNMPQQPENAEAIISAMLSHLDQGVIQAQQAFNDRNCLLVEKITSQMAAEAEEYGSRIVGRLARCVQRAAAAKDLAALGDLLPVLSDAVERNRIASSPRN